MAERPGSTLPTLLLLAATTAALLLAPPPAAGQGEVAGVLPAGKSYLRNNSRTYLSVLLYQAGEWRKLRLKPGGESYLQDDVRLLAVKTVRSSEDGEAAMPVTSAGEIEAEGEFRRPWFILPVAATKRYEVCWDHRSDYWVGQELNAGRCG